MNCCFMRQSSCFLNTPILLIGPSMLRERVREIRMWEKFFQTGAFDDDEREIGAAQEQTEELMMPPGSDPLTDE